MNNPQLIAEQVTKVRVPAPDVLAKYVLACLPKVRSGCPAKCESLSRNYAPGLPFLPPCHRKRKCILLSCAVSSSSEHPHLKCAAEQKPKAISGLLSNLTILPVKAFHILSAHAPPERAYCLRYPYFLREPG